MGSAIFFCHVPSATTGDVYHATSRGNARQDIIAVDQDHTLFLYRLFDMIDHFSWRCHIPQ